MKLNTLTTAQLNGSIKNLEHAKANRQGGLLVTEQTALDSLVAERTLRTYVEGMKAAIIADMKDDTVPETVKTYSELHDYVDANEYCMPIFVDYGVFSKDGDIMLGLGTPEGDKATEVANSAMDRVDEWLRNGRK